EDGQEKVILPVWHNVSHADIIRLSPLLADKLAAQTSTGLENVAQEIQHAIAKQTGRSGPVPRRADEPPHFKVVDQAAPNSIFEPRSFIGTAVVFAGALSFPLGLVLSWVISLTETRSFGEALPYGMLGGLLLGAVVGIGMAYF